MQFADLKILIAEDDEDDVILIREFIRDGFPDTNLHFDWASSATEALSRLENNDYNFCFFDLRLGEKNGLQLLRSVREKGYTLPIIFLTGHGDEETAVEIMKSGATDYLAKSSLSAKSLAHAIHQALRIHEEAVQRRKAESALSVQDQLLQAVSDATNSLLILKNHHEAIAKALDILGKALNFKIIEIYQGNDEANGSQKFMKGFSWNQDIACNGNSEGIFHEQTIQNLQMQDSFNSLMTENFIQIQVNSLSEKIANQIQLRGVSLLSLVPIIIDEAFWGFIAFGDSQPERQWSKSEESLLKAVAANIGSEIRRHTDETAFHAIVEGTTSRVGDEFFLSLVRHLAAALPVSKVFVSEMLSYNSSECMIVAGWNDGEFLNDQMFNIKGTPYEEVLAGMISINPDSRQGEFNGRMSFSTEDVRSYAAVPCFDSKCKIIGHLSIMDEKPMADRQRTLSILKLFAARAGAELERKRTEGLIRNMAYHDALTGLPNRVLLNDRLEMAMAQAQRSQSMLAVLFLDFDHFKKINDDLGHGVGDQVLKKVGARLKKCLRNQDTVARLGGDEFILLLPEINSPRDADNLAKKLLHAVSQPLHVQGHELRITLSVGVALYPRDGENSTTLLKHADDALYLAKKQGKNCYQFFNPQLMRVDS
jgi:diguanylate cyclase (GGDEF)-like protein